MRTLRYSRLDQAPLVEVPYHVVEQPVQWYPERYYFSKIGETA